MASAEVDVLVIFVERSAYIDLQLPRALRLVLEVIEKERLRRMNQFISIEISYLISADLLNTVLEIQRRD